MTAARRDTPRGWVEERAITARTGPAFAVYDLTESRARARLVYQADSRACALAWALRWASRLTPSMCGRPITRPAA